MELGPQLSLTRGATVETRLARGRFGDGMLPKTQRHDRRIRSVRRHCPISPASSSVLDLGLHVRRPVVVADSFAPVEIASPCRHRRSRCADIARLFVRYPLRWLVPAVCVAVGAAGYALLKPATWEATLDARRARRSERATSTGPVGSAT